MKSSKLTLANGHHASHASLYCGESLIDPKAVLVVEQRSGTELKAALPL